MPVRARPVAEEASVKPAFEDGDDLERRIDNTSRRIGCLGLVGMFPALVLVMWVSREYGRTVVLLLFAGLVAAGACWLAIDHLGQRRAARREALAPCEHGSVGARHDTTACVHCVAANAAREREAAKAKEKERLKADSERRESYRRHLAQIRLPEYLKTMHPRAFEILVLRLFQRMGYEVEITPYTGDGGVDGWLRRAGSIHVLQCKRVKASVGFS